VSLSLYHCAPWTMNGSLHISVTHAMMLYYRDTGNGSKASLHDPSGTASSGIFRMASIRQCSKCVPILFRRQCSNRQSVA